VLVAVCRLEAHGNHVIYKIDVEATPSHTQRELLKQLKLQAAMASPVTDTADNGNSLCPSINIIWSKAWPISISQVIRQAKKTCRNI
jgi:hypothetical protein